MEVQMIEDGVIVGVFSMESMRAENADNADVLDALDSLERGDASVTLNLGAGGLTTFRAVLTVVL
jgi:hypothetical protein